MTSPVTLARLKRRKLKSGGVPSFWQQIRDPEAIEIVEDRQQRSFGIGVLRL